MQWQDQRITQGSLLKKLAKPNKFNNFDNLKIFYKFFTNEEDKSLYRQPSNPNKENLILRLNLGKPN